MLAAHLGYRSVLQKKVATGKSAVNVSKDIVEERHRDVCNRCTAVQAPSKVRDGFRREYVREVQQRQDDPHLKNLSHELRTHRS